MVVVQTYKNDQGRKRNNKIKPVAQSKSRRRSHDGRQFTYDIQTCSVVKGEIHLCKCFPTLLCRSFGLESNVAAMDEYVVYL